MIETNQSYEINREGYGLVGYAFFFFFGIISASFIIPGNIIISCGLLLSGAAIYLNRKSKTKLKVIFMLLIFLLGMLDYSISYRMRSKLDVYDKNNAVYECLIIDNPVEKGGYVQYTAKSLSVIYNGRNYNYNEKVFLRINKDKKFKFGDKIRIEGECSDITGIRNPGDFSYKLYYKSKGICKLIKADNAVLLKESSAGFFKTILHMSKEKVKSTINQALPESEAAVLVGIVTGDKADIDEDTRENYMKTGLSHLLSVSGLHVGFLMLLLRYALCPLHLKKGHNGVIIFSVITYYVLLIGAPLPSVRALIMLGVLLVGKSAGRKYDILTSVSFAGMLMLVFKPLAVHDPSFMISFGAMYSIALFYPPFLSILRCIPGLIRSSAALSLAVCLGLAPVLAYYFNYVSIISIIANIIVVPISFVITTAGFIGVFAGIISKTLSLYIFSVDYYLINLLNLIIQKASGIPYTGFNIPKLPVYIYALYYAGIVLWIAFIKRVYFRIYIRKFVLAYLLTAAVAFSVYNLPSGELKMVFFDVGQGDSCCIITPDKKVILIDSGGSSGRGEYYYDVGGKITLPALLHQGIWRIDTVIVSHLHDDHMEGLLKVMEVYPVKNLILSKASTIEENISGNSELLLDLCRSKGIKVYRLGKGDYITMGKEIRMDFLLPGKDAKSDENENSLVSLLVYENFRALFTGDIGGAAEAELPGDSIGSAVLKVPHHGSKGSSSKEFLDKVRPKLSIISVGNNNFGHPSEDTVKRLCDCGSLVYRTDESGAITITTNGRNMKVKTVR